MPSVRVAKSRLVRLPPLSQCVSFVELAIMNDPLLVVVCERHNRLIFRQFAAPLAKGGFICRGDAQCRGRRWSKDAA